ncbi:MAG TPA: hypothetical protein VIJ20_02350, partial [Solirubrobacteraceae bacterium]
MGLGAGARSRLSDRGWLLTGAAGIVQLGGLALVLAGASLAVLAAVVAGAGVLLGGYVLAPRAIAAVRQNRGLILFAALLVVGAWYVMGRLMEFDQARLGPTGPLLPFVYGPRFIGTLRFGGAPLLPIAAILLATAAGLVLNADAVRIWLGFSPHQRAPWSEMTETQERSGGIAWRATLGVLLVGLAAFLAIGLAGRQDAGHPELEAIVLV